MSLPGLLCQVGLKQLFDVTSKEVAEWVDSRFEDSSRAVLHTIFAANRRAWTVIGLALTERTFAGRVRDLIHEADVRAARDEIRQLLAATPAEHRRLAASELDRLHEHHQNATPDALSGAEALFRRFGDPAGVAAEADRAAGLIPDTLATDAPHLVVVLRLTPDGRTALFQAMFRYHFRKRAVKHPELSGLLLHDQLRALAEQTDGRTAGILDQFDVLFDRLDAGFAEVKEEVRAGFAEMGADLRAIKERLAAPRKPGVTYTDAEELAFLEKAKAAFRKNPARVSAVQWEQLADAESAAKRYKDAAESHEAAAATAHAARDTAAEAANHYKAYLDACDAGLWPKAFEVLWKAVELDPAKYAPFDRDRYTPVRILGGGAFGTVFLCRDEINPNGPLPVAIKSYRTESLDRDLAKVFAEALSLKSLGNKYKSIIGVIDQGFGNMKLRARPYLILEYFAGQTLDQVGRLPLADFFPVARQVAEAVHAAHTQPEPIYHRDLKPSNIMVQRDAHGTWTVKVIDFGLAVRPAVARAGQAVPSAHRSTKDKSVTGTLKYAPPEQTGDLPGVEVGAYSDVFAFGKTCLDVLFGTTSPAKWDWAKIPADIRDPLQELLERCKADSLEHRHRNFEPVLKTLAELDPGEAANRERQEAARRREQGAAERERAERVRLAAAAAEAADRQRREGEAAARRAREEAERQEAQRRREQEETEEKRREDEARRKAEALRKAEADERRKQEQAEREEEERRKATQANQARQRAEQERAEREAERQREQKRQREDERRTGQARRKGVLGILGCFATVIGVGCVVLVAGWLFQRERKNTTAEQLPVQGGTGAKVQPPPVPTTPTPGDERKVEQPPVPTNPKPGDVYALKIDGVEMKFCWIPPGNFQMGGNVHSDEKPVHKVTITKGFWMGQTEVTQAQWKAVMNTDPSHFKGPNRPVEQVSWEDCQEFCRKFTASLNGRVTVRLPTEAEWEYACRAGTTSDYWSGNDEAALKTVGWYSATSKSETQPVGQLKANPWGLFDVHGNVWEWCHDGKREYTAQDQVDPE